MKRKNAALILAGGVGSRSGLDIPKQFFLLAGKTVLEHAVDAFQNSPDIDEIVIVADPIYHGKIQKLCGHASKLKKLLISGKERHLSTLSALKAYEGEKGVNLFIHDAARPLVSARIIHGCAEALKKYASVGTAVPSSDTLMEIEGGFLCAVPLRSRYWRAQTPQCFHKEVLEEAYAKALADPDFQTTDDCKIVHIYCPHVRTYIVQGEESNLKLTHSEDIFFLEGFLKIGSEKEGDKASF